MRAVIKRVSAADVTIKTDLVASIEAGLCVLVGFHKDDTEADLAYIVKKILNTKLFAAEGVEDDCTVIEKKLEILCVSQPVLFAIVKGNKLEYPDSMPEEASAACFKSFVAELKTLHGSGRVKGSDYGDYMEVHVENDGAVTLMLDSRDA